MGKGRYGIFGGQYIPETLMNAVEELEEAYARYSQDPEFQEELADLLKNYAGRPSMLYYAEKMTRDLKGAKIYLKREDLNHTGSHKINNVLGQALLAKKMGKTRITAETGAGQHGVAAATAAALMDMECDIYMGKEDMDRQALNVYRMELLGAKVHGVSSGTGTLKDAVNETMREWTRRMEDTLYVLGSVMGPHPFPMMVRDFQKVIGKEIREQLMEKEGRLPDAVIACVGGGSNAMGAFYEFIPDDLKSLKQIELDVELECAIPFVLMDDIFRYAVKEKEVYIISDMYLPKDHIIKMLEKCNLPLDKVKIYISYEYGVNKVSGKLFRKVLNENSIDHKTMIHFGDSLKADVLGAIKAGIKFAIVPKKNRFKRIFS